MHTDTRPDAFGIAGKMQVGRGVNGIVADLDGVAASPAPTGAEDGSVTDTHHGCARRRGIVHGRMRPDLSGDRMLAVIGKAAADAGIFQWRLQEGLPQALALRVPIAVSTVPLVEQDGREIFPAGRIDRIIQRIHVDDLSLAHRLSVQNAEPVLFLQAEEIHRPGIHLGQLGDQVSGGAGGHHIVPQRSPDGHIGIFQLMLHRFHHAPGRQGIRTAEYRPGDPVVFIHHVFEPMKDRILAVIGMPMIAGAHLPDIENRIQARHQRIGIRVVHPQPDHQA